MSNQLRGNRIYSLPTSIYSIKMATVDKVNKFAAEQRREIARREAQNHNRDRDQEKKRKKPVTPIKAWLSYQWRLRWDKYRKNKYTLAYYSALDAKPLPKDLYMGLSRAKSSILTQLHTGAISLNDFLITRNVLNITPECKCGWVRQTPKHIIIHCLFLGGKE